MKINKWLTPQLRSEVQQVFSRKYGRCLSDEEVVEIATSLSVYVEHALQIKSKNEIE